MKFIKYIISALLLLVSLSCTTTDSTEHGNLSLKLTDAPMPYNQFMEANVTIDKIEIGNSSNPNSFVTIMDSSTTYNMLDMINGITETLANASIPVGDYDTIRLYMSSSEMVTNNGESYSYDMSQNGMSGGSMMGASNMVINNENGSIDITLDHMLNVQLGSDNEYLLDIDVEHSFMLEGVSYQNAGNGMMLSMTGFTFTPTMRFVAMNNAGTISGNIHDDQGNLAGVSISLMQNNETYTTTHTDENGNYTFIGIPQGMYTINAESDDFVMSTTGNESSMGDIQMMSNAILTIDFNMMASN
ncbi:DUF4382 domain-containing protein [Lutibacter sp.]|uniref:DUF4382 domain-containing protein n=1 Tax=Lutibacter sp. TaxID=1925666 RepID=UPI0025C4F489|nr:DUF4382 domain-containing protein [Lutibacter sp.]MCF6181191.1 DUF4382 domain-containing protein [Lutibacter sp.]